MAPAKPKARCLACATFAMALVFSWWWLDIRANYGGNWTGLYCTGAVLGAPAALAHEHIFLISRSGGFDGQMYHYIAHDPLIRDRGLKAFVDDPSLRYRRILIPGLAYLLSFGYSDWVDPAYYALVLIFIGGGAYWTAAWCAAAGHSPAWGLLFLILPATLASVDRMTVDVALAALAAGFAYHVRAPELPAWRLFLILAAAALARETGLLLIVGYCGALALRRRPARAAIAALAALPAFAWYAYVYAHTAVVPYPANFIPLSAIWSAFTHPYVYPATMPLIWLVRVADTMAIAGMLAAFGLALLWFFPRRLEPVPVTALCFVAMGLLFQNAEQWRYVYDFGRVYTPVLLFLGFEGLRRRSWLPFLLVLLMLPRIGMQVSQQVIGVARMLL